MGRSSRDLSLVTYFQPVTEYCGSVVWTNLWANRTVWDGTLMVYTYVRVRWTAASPQEIVGNNSGQKGRLGQNRVSAAN